MLNKAENAHPRLLSLEFHTRFFPALLFGRLRPAERDRTGFTSTTGLYVLLVVCFVLVIIGAPGAVANKSLTGWAMAGLGAAGITALSVNSIFSRMGAPLSYDGFLKGVFFFFVTFGVSAGVFVGSLKHSIAIGLPAGAGGFAAGYLLGILAGFWFQYLGWMAALINYLAYLAVLGLLCVDIVLLFGSFF